MSQNGIGQKIAGTGAASFLILGHTKTFVLPFLATQGTLSGSRRSLRSDIRNRDGQLRISVSVLNNVVRRYIPNGRIKSIELDLRGVDIHLSRKLSLKRYALNSPICCSGCGERDVNRGGPIGKCR